MRLKTLAMWSALLLIFTAFIEQRWELIQLQKQIKVQNRQVTQLYRFVTDIVPKRERNPIPHLVPDIDPALADTIYKAVKFASYLYNVPKEIILSMILTESTFNPVAVSNRGCIGLMQVCPKVWRINRNFLYDPVLNVMIGTKIISYYYARSGGSWKRALAMYSGGATNYFEKTFAHVTTVLSVQNEELLLEP